MRNLVFYLPSQELPQTQQKVDFINVDWTVVGKFGALVLQYSVSPAEAKGQSWPIPGSSGWLRGTREG